jgi:hypothetical protein
LDVVKLTAQFVARNGRHFLTNLMNREQRNYQVSLGVFVPGRPDEIVKKSPKM